MIAPTFDREAYPDSAQFDPASKYHDTRATPEASRRWVVDIASREKFEHGSTLTQIKGL